jgi:hypothetical protein
VRRGLKALLDERLERRRQPPGVHIAGRARERSRRLKRDPRCIGRVRSAIASRAPRSSRHTRR